MPVTGVIQSAGAGAFPVVASVGETAAAAVAPFDANMPTGIEAGDLLLLLLTRRIGAQTFTYPSGWVELWNETPGNWAAACAYKIADGSEGSTISIDSTDDGSRLTTVWIGRITGAHASAAPESSAATTGTSTAPDPASLTPSWGADKTLWIGDASQNNDVSFTAYPSDYNDNQTTLVTLQMAQAVATRELESGTEDPGAFALASSTDWFARTIAIRPE